MANLDCTYTACTETAAYFDACDFHSHVNLGLPLCYKREECIRPEDHDGPHMDTLRKVYWQSDIDIDGRPANRAWRKIQNDKILRVQRGLEALAYAMAEDMK